VDEIGVYKHEGTSLVDISGDTTFTHRAGGMYTVTLDTGDTDTVGRLRLFVRDDDACLPMWKDFMVLPANVFDAQLGNDKLQVDATQIEGGDATAAINAEVDTAIETYRLDELLTAALSAQPTASSLLADLTEDDGGTQRFTSNALEQGPDTTTGIELADDAITSAKYDESTAYPLESADSGSTEVARTGADSDTLEDISDEIAGLNDPASADIADAVWDEAQADHTSAGSTGESLDDAGGGASAADIADAVLQESVDDHKGTAGSLAEHIDEIQADTNELQSDDVPGLISGLNDISASDVDAEVDEAIENYRLDELITAALSAQPSAGSLLGDLTEDDGGTQRFTANALEQGPDTTTGITLSAAYDDAKTAAQAGDEMALTDDAITSDKYDETTAYPLKSEDSGSTEVARTGADSDTLEDISDEVAALNDISVSDILAGVIEGTYSLKEWMRLMGAVLFGDTSGGGTATAVFKDTSGSTDRVTATLDNDGNRDATLDAS